MTTDQHYLSGYVAAVANIVITFPINKAVFRQRLHGVNALESVRQLRAEGFLKLYRGILPPLLQKSTQTSIMFGSFNQYEQWLREAGLKENNSKIFASLMAGATEATLAPFERVQTLMMDRKNTCTFKTTPHAFALLRPYGIKEYYRGLTAILLRNGPGNIIFFCCRDNLGERLRGSFSKQPMLADFMTGAILGAFISTVTFPINTTKTHMMKTWGGNFRSFHTVFGELVRERGMRGMFCGAQTNCMRSVLGWGIVNLVTKYFERISR